MNFSKRSRYGIRALIDMAQNSESCMQLNDIAERNGIPAKYLEQIFSALRKAGILRSVKGAQGGYFLARKPGDLKLADIIQTLDEEFRDGEKGEAEAFAVQTEIIAPINEQIYEFLNTLTLRKLTECSEQYKETAQDMYYI